MLKLTLSEMTKSIFHC